MKISICIGSSCHLKGSRQVLEELQNLVRERNLKDKVELCGAFCMGDCTNGVCIKIDEEMYSLRPENTVAFFEEVVIKKLKDK